MLDYAIFAATFVIFLILSVIYLYPGSKKLTTIPGPEPVDPLEGNIPDITACESLHEFLAKIHEDYGAIASFWYGPKMCVSVASPNLLEEQSAVFDRPYDIYKGLTLLLGEDTALLANGANGRKRQALYAKAFSQGSISKKLRIFNNLSEQVVERWKSCPKEEYIPVMSHMYAFAIKSSLQSAFGMDNVADGLVNTIKASFDVCWTDTEKLLIGDWMESGSPRDKRFMQHKGKLDKVIEDAIKCRKESASTEREKCLLDVVLDADLPETTKSSDLLMIFVLGFYKTALVLTWCMYFLASNEDIQEKARAEVLQFVDKADDITEKTLSNLKYLQQVLKETLRRGLIMPYAARYQDFDTVLGGHKIPAGTPVVQALGVIMSSETVYPDPESFLPDRFSEENEKLLPSFSFQPYGFAGKRSCPGSHLAMAEVTVIVARLLRAFTLRLAPDQVVVPEYGFMTKPKDEVWLTTSPIKQNK